MVSVQSMLFDKILYSYVEAVKYMLLEGYLRHKYFGITTQHLRFKFSEPDETKYSYKIERVTTGIHYQYIYINIPK